MTAIGAGVNHMLKPERWMESGLCAQTDPELQFPEKGGSAHPGKTICRACPVAAECLEYALKTAQQDGIWGGYTARERLRMRRAA